MSALSEGGQKVMNRPCLALLGVLALMVTPAGCESEQAQTVKIGFLV